jgi:hypothetical protein
MKKIDLGQTITILANVGVIAGIVFLGIELNQNTRQLALELQWRVNDRMIQNNRDLMGANPVSVFAKSVDSPEEMTFEEFQAAGALVFNFLGVWEDRYFLYEAGLIEDEEWKEFIDDDIFFTLGYRFAQEFWQESKSLFEPEFVEYVDQKIQSVDANANYQWWLDTMERLRAAQ